MNLLSYHPDERDIAAEMARTGMGRVQCVNRIRTRMMMQTRLREGPSYDAKFYRELEALRLQSERLQAERRRAGL